MAPRDLAPLPYQDDLVSWLKQEEAALWTWQSGVRHDPDAIAAVRLQLLKTTYRLDQVTHAGLYERSSRLAARLGLALPITLYQAQPQVLLNAALQYIPGEVHVIFMGPLLITLTESEVDAVIGHELGHYLLWSGYEGRFGVADRLLGALEAEGQAEPAHLQTCRRWRLAAELFADRAALAACGDLATVVATLVRIETGAGGVDAQAYLAQAAEVLQSDGIQAEGPTHPECFIRAAALAACAQELPDAEHRTAAWLNGPLDPHTLDVLGQRTCLELTRTLLQQVLEPAWLRSEAVLAHVHLFFPDLALGGGDAARAARLDGQLRGCAPGLRDYVASLLIDLAAADPDLTEVAVAHGLLLAERWGFAERVAELAHRDLKLKLKDLARLRQQAQQLVTAAAAASPGGAA